MGQVSEMVEMQERFYILKDEQARRQKLQGKGKKSAARRSTEERRLQQIEAGLYPTCESCGKRIEMERLRADAFVATCEACAGKHP